MELITISVSDDYHIDSQEVTQAIQRWLMERKRRYVYVKNKYGSKFIEMDITKLS